MKLISKKIWNLPNALTIFRIVLIPVFVAIMYRTSNDNTKLNLIAAAVYLVAVLTDIVDGRIARHYKIVTPVGKLLDPLADKLLVTSALIMLTWGPEARVSPWIAIVIIGREIAVTGLRSITSSSGVVIAASSLGKWKMFIQSIGIIGMIWYYNLFGLPLVKLAMIIMYAAVAVTLWSGYDYFAKFIDMATKETSEDEGDAQE